MNEEVNALLQAYQGRVNQLTAQNIAFEAKVVVHPDIRKKVIRLLDEKNIKEISIPKIEIDIGCVPLSNDLGDVIAEKTVEIMTDT